MSNAAASFMSVEFGITGPAYTVSTACASANHAIGQAFWMVRNGVVDCALTGGSEAVFSYGFLKAWEAMRVVSSDTCRPFSKNRSGLILGEAGAMLVLEPLEAARARGATIYAELKGFGMTADAHHITQPSREGPGAAMRACLEDACLAPESSVTLTPTAPGRRPTMLPRRAPFATCSGPMRTVWLFPPPRASTGMLSARRERSRPSRPSSLSARASCRRRSTTANRIRTRPRPGAEPVPPEEVETALSNSFAFGGLNAVLAFARA